MTVRIENQTCYLRASEDTPERSLPADQVVILTDDAKSMSYVESDDGRIYITEADADALTVANATDKRHHVAARDPDPDALI